jgi:hypothetical protein
MKKFTTIFLATLGLRSLLVRYYKGRHMHITL